MMRTTTRWVPTTSDAKEIGDDDASADLPGAVTFLGAVSDLRVVEMLLLEE